MPESEPLHDDIHDIALLEKKLVALEADLRQKKEIILAQHNKLEAFFDTSIDAVVQMDFDGYITGWNHQAEKIFGWRAEEILDQTIEETIIPERHRAAHRAGMQRYLRTGESSVMNQLIEMHALHRDGHEFPVELSIAVIDSPDLQEFNAYIRDISQRKQSEKIIWQQVNFDSLTGLPNRNMFLQRLEHELRNCDRSELSLALLYIDLDRFKEINDSMGHDKGDLLLIETANRLKQAVREVDTVARLSGDEFTIILGQIDDQLSVQRVCQQLLANLSQPMQPGNERAHITASIGVSFYPGDATDPEVLLRNADQAMYSAKGQGRNRYQFFTPELQERALRKRTMIDDLHAAVRQAQFEVYYQPIIRLHDDSLSRAEALIRWHHPQSGMVSPAVFIPIAEETGLIGEIGNWVFYQACEQLQHWRRSFDIDFQININTSLQQWVDDSAPMNQWFSHMHAKGIGATAIGIEFTESLLMNAGDRITNCLLEFREAGMQMVIDDFGTGYSSLSNLRHFDIGSIKIDRSFVRNLELDKNDRDLCEAIIVMAHKLDIEVIAEGVETRFQDQLLRDFGCDYAQGYLYSRPVPAIDLTALIASRT